MPMDGDDEEPTHEPRPFFREAEGGVSVTDCPVDA